METFEFEVFMATLAVILDEYEIDIDALSGIPKGKQVIIDLNISNIRYKYKTTSSELNLKLVNWISEFIGLKLIEVQLDFTLQEFVDQRKGANTELEVIVSSLTDYLVKVTDVEEIYIVNDSYTDELHGYPGSGSSGFN